MAGKQQNGKGAAAGGAAAGGAGAPPPVAPVVMGDLNLPDPAKIKVLKRKVADRIMQAIERAGQRELTQLSIPDAGQWNVKRPDVQKLALELTDDAFGKIITTARDRLRTGLAEELDKNQDQFQIAANLRERFGGMNERDARRVVRTVFRDLYNQASLDVYDAIGVEQVLAADGHGGLTGRTDPDCIARNGQTFTLAEARELRAYHPTVHPNCTLSFSPIMPPGGLSGQIDLPPVEDAPDVAADLGGSDDQMLMAAWTPDEEALHPKWPQGTPGEDPSGHHLAGEFMEMGQLGDLFKSLANPSDSINVSFLAHGSDNIASIKVTQGHPTGPLSAPPLTQITGIASVKKLQHVYAEDGTYMGQVLKKSTSYNRIYVRSPQGAPTYFNQWVYSSSLESGTLKVSDQPPAELDKSATFDIILKAPKLAKPGHIQVHIDQVSKLKTASFVQFLAALNNGEDLTAAKNTLDSAHKPYSTSTPYAKPTIHKKLNYTAYQKHIGGGKQEGAQVGVTALKTGDSFLLPEGWGSPADQGQVAKVQQPWKKSTTYLSYQVMTGDNAGTHNSQYLSTSAVQTAKVVFSQKAKPPPPPPKVGDTVPVEHLMIGAKLEVPVGTEGTHLKTSGGFGGTFKWGQPQVVSVTGIAPDGGIKVDTGEGHEISLPTGTQVKYAEKPPQGGGSSLQPGILDQFGFNNGKVTPPVVAHAVDSSSHDPSIPIPPSSSVTPEMWARFGKEDQERYAYLQQKFGAWSSGKGKTAMDALRSSINSQIKHKVEEAYNKQYGQTGANGVVTPDSPSSHGGAGFMTLNVANEIPLSTWQQDQKTVDPEGQFNSWAEAMNYGLLRWEEVAQWDMYNRVGEPDLLMFHGGTGNTKSKVIDAGVPITGGYSWSYYPGAWGEGTVDAIPLPIRYLTMNYFVPPSSGHIHGEHEVASRYFIQVPKDSPFWYHASSSKFGSAWQWGTSSPQGGSKWAQMGQKMGIVKLSPAESYAQMPTVKAKTMHPGATFQVAHEGKFPTWTVDKVYGDGSFTTADGKYFPANADVKQVAPGTPPKAVGKLVNAALSDTQMGNKVYDQSGKVIGYVSTPGQSWKGLAEDGVTVTDKHTPGESGTILTVMPVEAGDMKADDQFFVPGTKGQKIGKVVTNNGGTINWVQVGGSDSGSLPNAHSPVYPLPKPDSAFAPPPAPPKGLKPFIPDTPDAVGKVDSPYVPPPPVSGATLQGPAAAQVTPAPGGTPISFADVKVGDVLQVEKATAQSYIGTKLEVTSISSEQITATYLDGPMQGKVQTMLPHQFSSVTFSKVTQQATPAGEGEIMSIPEAKKLAAQAPANADEPGVGAKKITEASVGDVLYSADASSPYWNQPFAVVIGVNDKNVMIYNVKSDATVPFHKGSSEGLSPIGVWTPPGAAGGPQVPGAIATHEGQPVYNWDALKQGHTFTILPSHAKPGGQVNPEFVGATAVVDSIAVGGAVHYHYTSLPNYKGTVTKLEHALKQERVKSTATTIPITITPPAPETPASTAEQGQTGLHHSDLKVGDKVVYEGGISFGSFVGKQGTVVTQAPNSDGILTTHVNFGGTTKKFNLPNTNPTGGKFTKLPAEAAAPAPGGGTTPALTKTKVSTMKVGDHLYSYTTENYVGEVTAKNADGGVTVTKPDGSTKNYGAKSSVKKGTSAPGAAAPAAVPAGPVEPTPKEQMPAEIQPADIAPITLGDLQVGSVIYGGEVDGTHKKIGVIVGPDAVGTNGQANVQPGQVAVQLLTPGTNIPAPNLPVLGLPQNAPGFVTTKVEAQKLGVTPLTDQPISTLADVENLPVNPEFTQVNEIPVGTYFVTDTNGNNWFGYVMKNEGENGNVQVKWLNGPFGTGGDEEKDSVEVPYDNFGTAAHVLQTPGLFDEGAATAHLTPITPADVGKLVPGDKVYVNGTLSGTVIGGHQQTGIVTYKGKVDGLPNTFSVKDVNDLGGTVSIDHPLADLLPHEQPLNHTAGDLIIPGSEGGGELKPGAILTIPHDAVKVEQIKHGAHVYDAQGNHVGIVQKGGAHHAVPVWNAKTGETDMVPWGTVYITVPGDHPPEGAGYDFQPSSAVIGSPAKIVPEIPPAGASIPADQIQPGDKVLLKNGQIHTVSHEHYSSDGSWALHDGGGAVLPQDVVAVSAAPKEYEITDLGSVPYGSNLYDPLTGKLMGQQTQKGPKALDGKDLQSGTFGWFLADAYTPFADPVEGTPFHPSTAPVTPASGVGKVDAGSLKPGDKVVVPDVETVNPADVGKVGTVEKVGPGGITYAPPDGGLSGFIPATTQVHAQPAAAPGGEPKALIQIGTESGNKKASSFQVGQAAYSYHSGKLIGTVTSKGDGVVEITKPDGTTKTYKATTTWRYDKNAPLPSAAPAVPEYVPQPPPAGTPEKVDATTLTPLTGTVPDHPVAVYDKFGVLQGTFDPKSPYNQPGPMKPSSIGNGGGIAEFTKPDGTLGKIGKGNLHYAPTDAGGFKVGDPVTMPDGSHGHVVNVLTNEGVPILAVKVPGHGTVSMAPSEVTHGHVTPGEAVPGYEGGKPLPNGAILLHDHEPTYIQSVYYGGHVYGSGGEFLGTLAASSDQTASNEHVTVIAPNGVEREVPWDTVVYSLIGDASPGPNDEPDPGSVVDVLPLKPETAAQAAAAAAPHPATELTPVSPQELEPYVDVAGAGQVGTPLYGPYGDPLGTFHHDLTYDDGTEAVAYVDTNGNTATLDVSEIYVHLGGDEPSAHLPTGTAGFDAPPSLLPNGTTVYHEGKQGTLHKYKHPETGESTASIDFPDGSSTTLPSIDTPVGYATGQPETPPAPQPHVPEPAPPAPAPEPPAAPSVGHVGQIDPKANPSKKAGSMAVGQPVYNYHSGKLVGTVEAKYETGDPPFVTVKLPDGTTKDYKFTTTWKYLGGSAGAANAPAASSAVEKPQDVLGDTAPPAPIYQFKTLAEWDNHGAAGGTQGAQWFTDPATGQKYVVKGYNGDQSRVATEALAGAIYKALGVDVPDTGTGTMLDGTRVFVSKALPGNPKAKVLKGQPKSKQLGQGFMADALLANHDVVGLEDDNILWDANGKPYRVDLGGTFFYRAMGEKKDFGPVPKEVQTMLDPKRQAGRTMIVTETMKKEQAANIANTLTPDVIHKLAVSAGFPSEAETNKVELALAARVDWMKGFAAGKYDLPAPGEKPPTGGGKLEVSSLTKLSPASSKNVTAVALAENYKQVAAAISKIHQIQPHPDKAKVKSVYIASKKIKSNGAIHSYPGGFPVNIEVSTNVSPEHRPTTLAHEIGHMIDMLASSENGKGFASENGEIPAFKHLMDVIGKSESIKYLKTTSEKTKHRSYLLRKREQFARAYAQYIALRSGNKAWQTALRTDVSATMMKNKSVYHYPYQWTDSDFAAIAKAFDQLFKEMGWA